MKTLILYVFHQECDNLRLFINKGLVQDENKTFIFIYNNPDPCLDSWKFMQNYNNVHLFIRPNVGQDFQGWNDTFFLPASVLNTKIIKAKDVTPVTDNFLYEQYDRFVCVNSTVAGPYIPLYVKDDWIDCFTAHLSNIVKLVGISANFISGRCDPYISNVITRDYNIPVKDNVHIQSMVFGLDKVGLQTLMKYGLFKQNRQFPPNKWDVVCTGEVAMTVILRHEGFSIYSFRYGQGSIPFDYVCATDNYWNTRGVFPLMETMFVKVMNYIEFREKSRYDSQV